MLCPPTPRLPLTPSGKACAATALYIGPAGLFAAAFPAPLLAALAGSGGGGSSAPLVALQPWALRFAGLLAMTFGLYYAGAACGEACPGVGAGVGFKVATAVGRWLLSAALAVLAATTGGRAGAALAAFAVLNAAGGAAMAWALGKDGAGGAS